MPSGDGLTQLFGFADDQVFGFTSSTGVLSNSSGEWKRIAYDGTNVPADAWGAAPDDLWIVASYQGARFHWDGSVLSQELLTGRVDAIHGSAANNVWNVGKSAFVQHWDGTTWTDVPGPFSGDLSAVRVLAPGDAWIGGDAGLYRLSGTAWANTATAAIAKVSLIGSTSATDVWFAGEDSSGKPAIARYDGTGITAITHPALSRFTAIAAGASNNVWFGTWDGSLLHFDGTSVQTVPTTADDIRDLWVSPSGALWGVTDQPLPQQLVGSDWKPDPLENVQYSAVWGMSWDDMWAVGEGGSIVHFDGTTWATSTSPSADTLVSIWGHDESNVYAVSETGALLRWDSAAWRVQEQLGPGLRAIDGLAADDVWVLDASWGLTHVTSGNAQHHQLPDPPFDAATAMWVSGIDDVWAVGGLTIVRWVAGEWQRQELTGNGFDVGLDAIWGRSPTDVWVGGFLTGVRHFDGTGWTELTPTDAKWITGCDDQVMFGDVYLAVLESKSATHPARATNSLPPWKGFGSPNHVVTVGTRFGGIQRRVAP